jgi:hypothetical protein
VNQLTCMGCPMLYGMRLVIFLTCVESPLGLTLKSTSVSIRTLRVLIHAVHITLFVAYVFVINF